MNVSKNDFNGNYVPLQLCYNVNFTSTIGLEYGNIIIILLLFSSLY